MRSYVERIVIEILDRLTKLEEQLQRISQSLPGLWQRDGGGQGGNGAGGYYSDPGSTVVEGGGSAELTVMEVRASGDVEVGTRTVISRFTEDTQEDKRLILMGCRDGSFLIVNQDYPCPEDP